MASRSNSKVQPLPDIDRLAAMRDEAALLEQAEAVMDRYLNETSYYRQTMLSISTAAASVWRKKVRSRLHG